jgi:hypothetical protein
MAFGDVGELGLLFILAISLGDTHGIAIKSNENEMGLRQAMGAAGEWAATRTSKTHS